MRKAANIGGYLFIIPSSLSKSYNNGRLAINIIIKNLVKLSILKPHLFNFNNSDKITNGKIKMHNIIIL